MQLTQLGAVAAGQYGGMGPWVWGFGEPLWKAECWALQHDPWLCQPVAVRKPAQAHTISNPEILEEVQASM